MTNIYIYIYIIIYIYRERESYPLGPEHMTNIYIYREREKVTVDSKEAHFPRNNVQYIYIYIYINILFICRELLFGILRFLLRS